MPRMGEGSVDLGHGLPGEWAFRLNLGAQSAARMWNYSWV